MKKILVCLVALAICLLALASCGGPSDALVKAKDYVYSMYKDSAEATPSSFQVVGVTIVDGVSYDVEWTTDNSEVTISKMDEKKMVTVSFNEKTDKEIAYTLKATIKDADGEVLSVEFPHKVPAFKICTWQEYMNAAAGDVVVVKGIVTGIISKSNGCGYNCIYLEDNDGGYYVYGSATDPVEAGIKVGMEVLVSGTKDIYSGTHEVKDASYEITNTTINLVTPKDYTELYTNATSLKDESITAKQNSLVTLKGVEITGEDASNGYYKFKLGNLESYIRISSSVCPLVKADQATFKTAHADHLGWIADATGIICVYDGAFYLTPVTVDAYNYISLPNKSDPEKVEFEKANISFPANIAYDSVIDLIVNGQSYTDVVITWTSNSACAVVDGGKLTVTLPEEETVVNLTATITCGEATDTATFEVVVDAASKAMYIAEPLVSPEVGTYKFVLFQNKLGKTLYFDGTVNSSEYLATTEKAEKAADVTVTALDGSDGFTFTVGGKFIEVYKNDAGKIRVRLVDASTGSWKWNSEAGVFTFDVDGKTYYLGTYNTYDTFSASEIKYITGENLTKIGESQFPGYFANLFEGGYYFEYNLTPDAGTYKFIILQNKLGKTLYFDGTVNSSEYLATTDKEDKAADVTITALDGSDGFTLSVGGKFIEVYKNDAGKIRVHLVDASTGSWKWNTEAGVFTFDVDGKTYYLGTYNTYDTFSASEIKYITGENLTKIGESQFPGLFVELKVGKAVFKTLVAPAFGDYKFVLFQNKLGKTLYFDGTVNSSEYLATTEKADKAAIVTVTALDGSDGFTLSVGGKFIEVYKNDAGKIRVHLVDASTGSWKWNTEAGVFTFDVDGKTYYLGTYNTYDTFSASEIKYITGENLTKIGESQFPGYFGFVDIEHR